MAALTQLVDPTELRARFAGKPELLRRMIRIFDEQTPQLLGRLRHACRRGDGAGVESAAHALRGSLLQMCAQPTAELAEQIERAAQSAPPGRSEVMIKELEAQAAQVQRALNDLANSPDL